MVKNQIMLNQAAPENLNKMTAQRQIYTNAKNILGLQIIIQVILIILISLSSIFLSDSILKLLNIKKETINSMVPISSIAIAVVEYFIMKPLINHKRELAASIQEFYDCSVLSIPWNDINKARPELEVISKYSNKYSSKNSDIDSFKSWYAPSSLSTLPLPVARIICQLTNCNWDSTLRKKFTISIIVLDCLLLILLFSIALINGFSMETFLTCVVYPFVPAFTFTIDSINDNRRSIKISEDLKIYVDNLWHELLSSVNNFDKLNDSSRKLQDKIFENRKNSPLIFDWFYRRYKNEQQTGADYNGEEMLKEYLKELLKRQNQ